MPRIVRAGGVDLSGDVVKIRDLGPLPQNAEAAKAKRPFNAAMLGEEDGIAFAQGAETPAQEAPEEEGAAQDGPQNTSLTDTQGKPRPQEGGDIREGIVQSAMAEAGRILENAVRNAESQKAGILATVEQEAQRLREDAAQRGRREGYETAADTVRQAVDAVQGAIARFEGDRAGFEMEYEEQLRWIALEIASKVLVQKVEENDAVLAGLVEKAVQSVRGEPWIRVDVSQEMTRLIDNLTTLYAAQPNVEVSAVPLAPGTIQIETPTGVVDASLRTQLDNLRQYFAQNPN